MPWRRTPMDRRAGCGDADGLQALGRQPVRSLGADKAYDTPDLVQVLREMQVRPQVTQNLNRPGGSANRSRTTRQLVVPDDCGCIQLVADSEGPLCPNASPLAYQEHFSKIWLLHHLATTYVWISGDWVRVDYAPLPRSRSRRPPSEALCSSLVRSTRSDARKPVCSPTVSAKARRRL